MFGIRLEGWLTIGAVLLGPVIAVQLQKWRERRREELRRKQHLFRELMATRGTRLSPRNVEALNLIELEYLQTNRKQRPVFEAWRSYFDMLTPPAGADQAFFDRRDDAFVEVLYTMGGFLGFSFDRVAIKRNIYLPTLHHEMEQDGITIRKALVELLTQKRGLNIYAGLFSGHPPIKVSVTEEPAPVPGPVTPPPDITAT